MAQPGRFDGVDIACALWIADSFNADKSRITFHEVAERVLLGELDSTTFHSDGSTIDAFWDTNTGALHNNIAYHHGTTAERWSRIQTFHCEVAVPQ